MKKRIFASALAAVMALSLCACGGNAASSAAPSAGSAAPEETKAAQEINTPAEAASNEEASTTEPTTEYDPIEYPIEGDHSFTMTSVKRMNVAEALGDKDYSATISYEALGRSHRRSHRL